MQPVADNVYRMGTTYHNFYALVEGGKATVIDAGCSKELPVLVAGLESIGLKASDVEAVLLTHAHSDHMGFAAEAEKAGTTIRTHEIEAPIARGEVKADEVSAIQLPLWRVRTWRFLFALLKVGVSKAPRVTSVETFTDGEVLDLPGRPKAIHTPGHTIGHAAFYIPTDRLLFSGDAMVTMDVVGTSRGPQLLRRPFYTDIDQARDSLRHLEGLDTKAILPGHGDPWMGQASDAVAAVRGM